MKWKFCIKLGTYTAIFFYLSLSVHILLYFVNEHKGCSFCLLNLKNNEIFISQKLYLGHFRSLWTFISSIFIKPYYKIPQTLDMPCYSRFRYWTGSSYSPREIIMFLAILTPLSFNSLLANSKWGVLWPL